jgi:hypothetical protein
MTMLTPAEIDRKVRQLDDDVHAIYELIDNVRVTQAEHTRRLDVLDEKADAHGAKLDRIIDILGDR